MDRNTAFEILDAVHPDALAAAAEEDPRVAEAITVVESNAEDAEELQRRAEFDRRVTELVRDVEVPDGLRERLVERLGLDAIPETDVAASETVVAAPVTERVGRRRWLATIGTAATLLVVAGLGWWASRPVEPALTLADVETAAATALESSSSLAEFTNPPEAPLPWSRRRLRIGEEPSALTVAGGEIVPAYRFRAVVRGRGVEGIVVVLPADTLEAAPSSAFFDAGSAHYAERHASVSWAAPDGRFVYVCVVRGGAAELDTLSRALTVTPV